jgi:hypothetical protein
MAFSCISNRVIYLPPILTASFFPKNKKISAPPPCGFRLEYKYFEKIGQPKLSRGICLMELAL